MAFDLCHCGHHKDTHHGKKFSCLGSRCDCAEYLDADKPKKVEAPKVVAKTYGCTCGPLTLSWENLCQYCKGYP